MRAVTAWIICAFLFGAVISRADAGRGDDGAAWNLTAGGKGLYSSGVSDAVSYWNYYAKANLDLKYVVLNAEGGGYSNYQITDGDGNYRYIGLGEMKGEAKVRPVDAVRAGGWYRRGWGDDEFGRKEYGIDAELSLWGFTLSGTWSRMETEYLFDSEEMSLESGDYSANIAYEMTDTAEIEFGYTVLSLDFSSLDYEYEKRVARGGILWEIADRLFLMIGLSGGEDSDDYSILGADAGVAVYMVPHVKLMAFYALDYYLAPDSYTETDTSDGDGKGGGASLSLVGGGANPYLDPERVGENYWSHRLSVGAALSLH